MACGITFRGVVKATPTPSLYTPKPFDAFNIQILYCDKTVRVDEGGAPIFNIRDTDVQKEYRTMFGPIFIIPELYMPGQSADDHKIAIQRMISIRKPEKPGLHYRLIENQSDSSRMLRAGIHSFKTWFYQRINLVQREVGYPLWVFKPHAKKKLRVMTDELINRQCNDRFNDEEDVLFKLKNFEMLVANKKRGIGDLGAVRTNATAWCFDYIKDAMAGRYLHKGYRFEFVSKPDVHVIKRVLEELVSPIKGVYYVYFSDDCCVSASCCDGVVYFNGDISQCDGSHFSTLDIALKFLSVDNFGKEHCFTDTVKRAFSFLSRPLLFRNKFCKRNKIQYKFRGMKMYSGFAGTTVVNNIANMLIGLMLQRLCPDPAKVTKKEFQDLYVQAAYLVGYNVTVGVCECPEDLQFLKMSPSVVDGVLTPYMNIGVHLRGFGTFPYDLPGRGELRARAETFNSDVVKSRVHWGHHAIYDAFKHHIIAHSEVHLSGSVYAACFEDKVFGMNSTYIPLESIARRYRCSVYDLRELCSYIKCARYGDLVNLPILSTIYKKDYG